MERVCLFHPGPAVLGDTRTGSRLWSAETLGGGHSQPVRTMTGLTQEVAESGKPEPAPHFRTLLLPEGAALPCGPQDLAWSTVH